MNTSEKSPGLGGYFKLSNLKGDMFGGLTAGIVALPLALAFGEASGAGPIAGLWGAIFVGFFASLFGGTGSQVSGPTGPMVVVFAGLYAALGGNPSLVFAAVILAGLMQILLGITRFGQYVKLVPYPVISGFMSGIGVIIIALQLSRLFGHEPDGGGTIPAFTAVPDAVMNPNWIAVGIAILSLVMVFTWPKRLAAFIPGPLAALFAGTLVSVFIPGAPVLGDIPTGFPSFVVPNVDTASLLIVIEAAFILAVLGSIDSLLTSLVADNMTRTRHQSNKELIGQGIGNSVAGFFGAIPGAGATYRLPRLVGQGMARELIYTGRIIDAETAHQIGLLNRVVAAEQLLDTASELAQEISRNSAMALRFAKLSLNNSLEASPEACITYESTAQALLFEDEEKHARMGKFLERRQSKKK